MNFLVLGCNGMAGHMISLYLKEQGHNVLGFARSASKYVDTVIGTAENLEKLRSIIENGKFDVVVNCIGVLNQFADENKAQAVFLNGYLPHYLAEITADSKTQIIHMSTDCVFSGKKGSYVETDLRDGETFYDRTKAIGEIEDSKNITFRNSIIGPDINKNGIGLMNWFLQQEGDVSGYTKAIWTGQTTLQLAKTIEFAVKEGVSGLYNAVPNEVISKYELLQLMNKYIRREPINIYPVTNIVLDKSLKRTNFSFKYLIPSYEEMIKELAEWMNAHKNMYPHYNL